MTTEIKMPTININDDSVSLISWLVSDGESVFEGQPICEVETSKAIEEVLSPAEGFIRILTGPGDVATGMIIGLLMERKVTENSNSATFEFAHGDVPKAASSDESGQTRFTKAALAMMRENSISETAFRGRMFVRSADVVEYLGKGSERASQSQSGVRHVHSLGATGGLSPSKRRAQSRGTSGIVPQISASVTANEPRTVVSIEGAVPVTKRKKEEIRVLSEGHLSALPSVLTQIVDVSGLQTYLSTLDNTVTITIGSIVTFEVARLLSIYKEFNAVYTEHGIVYHQQIHVGMAIDGAHGLKVAAIENANQKTINDISGEMELLLNLYNDDRLTATSLTSATFNISDLTSFEIPWFTPLISRNQSAILGMGLSKVEDQENLTLTLTFDHRVTEGKRAAEFLRELKTRLTSYVLAAPQRRTPSEEGLGSPTCARCLRTAAEIPGDNKFLLQVMDTNGQPGWMCKPCVEGW